MLNGVVFWVEQTAVGLYILLGIGILRTVLWLGRARSNYRATYFELERDIAGYSRANAWTALILLVELLLVVIGVQQVVAPTLRAALDDQVRVFEVPLDDGEFRTLTPAAVGAFRPDASGVILQATDPANQVIATPTRTPTPVGTIIPNPPPAVGCDTANAFLEVPANGMIMDGPRTIRGTAYTENFSFYRFELSGPSTGNNFAPIYQNTRPIEAVGPLGQFAPAGYEEGDHQFRLVVFDLNGDVRAACTVNIVISAPIPTPTPLGTEAPR
ncbi:MAG: hypothetical protein GYB67_08520 [Chloroflexi bacterium]|nr:hypothetical protein [Chloroflexota bacterium]